MNHQLFVLNFADRLSPSLVCSDTEGPYKKAYLDVEAFPGKITIDQAKCIVNLNPRMWIDVCHVCQAELVDPHQWRRNI